MEYNEDFLKKDGANGDAWIPTIKNYQCFRYR